MVVADFSCPARDRQSGLSARELNWIESPVSVAEFDRIEQIE